VSSNLPSRVIEFALNAAQFETETAYNGKLALAAARSSQFDIVITDQQMPEMTGVELSRELRLLSNYVDCPIILLTAKGLELPQLREELGINATFPKPFSPSAVVHAVHELLATTVQHQ